MLAQEENILAIDGSFFVILILFIVLVILANKLIYKPVLQVLAERDRLTVGASGEATSIIEDYNKRLAHYENSIRQARSESYRDLEQRRMQGLAKRTEIIDSTKAEISGEVNAAKTDLFKQVDTAKNNLGTDARNIAAEISSAILKRSVGGSSR